MLKNMLKNVVIVLFLPVLVLQCDKSQPIAPENKSPDTTKISYDTTSLSVRISLPQGVTGVSVSSLTASNSISSMKLDNTGKAKLKGIDGGRQLTSVCDSNENVLLTGWVDATHPEINTQTSAAFLLYMNLALFTLPPALQEQAVSILEKSAEVAELSDSLAKMMSTNPDVLSDSISSIDPVVATLVSRIHSQCNLDNASQTLTKRCGLLIDPSGKRSGITLDVNGGINSIGFINETRRRIYVWLERVSYKSTIGTTIESPEVLQEFWGPMPTGITGVVSMIADVIRGRRAYSAAKTEKPFELPVYPQDAQSTQYKVSIVGPGGRSGDIGLLTDKQREQWEWVCQYSLLMDYVVPIVLNIVIPLNKESIDAWRGDGTTTLLKDILGYFITKSPKIANDLKDGKIWEATKDVINIIGTNGVTRDFFYNKIISLYEKTGDPSGIAAAKAQIKTLKLALRNWDIVLTSIDLSWQAENVVLCNQADVYNITAIPPKIVITPQNPQINPEKTIKLTASIPEAQGGPELSLTWKWSVKKALGTVTNDINTKEVSGFESTRNWATFKAGKDFGTDTVTVEAFQIRDGVKTPVGKGKTAVIIKDNIFTFQMKTVTYSVGDSSPDNHGLFVFAYSIFPKLPDAISYRIKLNDNGFPYTPPVEGGIEDGLGDWGGMHGLNSREWTIQPEGGPSFDDRGRREWVITTGWLEKRHDDVTDPNYDPFSSMYLDKLNVGPDEMLFVVAWGGTRGSTDSSHYDDATKKVVIDKYTTAEQRFANDKRQVKWDDFFRYAQHWTITTEKW